MIMGKISGLITMRAYDKIDLNRDNFIINLEKCANATFCFSITNRWLSLRLDIIMILILISVAALSVALKGKYSP